MTSIDFNDVLIKLQLQQLQRNEEVGNEQQIADGGRTGVEHIFHEARSWSLRCHNIIIFQEINLYPKP